MYPAIAIEKHGQADWLTPNRPDSLNAINLRMVAELIDYFGKLYNDGSVRVVIMATENRNQPITSASPNFAEGMKAFLKKLAPDYVPD